MTQITQIPTDQLFVGQINVRQYPGDVAELATSVKQHGVLHPIIVRSTDDGRYEVIAGSRRVAAARVAGLEIIPAIVKELDDEEAVVESLVENLQRNDLDVEDEGLAYERLIETLGSRRKVAVVVGKSEAHVRQTLDALAALGKLRSVGIIVSANQVRTQSEQDDRQVLPARHASELETAFRSPSVSEHLSAEEKRQKYIELAQTILPLSRSEAKRVLALFKRHPERSIGEIKAQALSPVDTRAQPHTVAQDQGASPETVLGEMLDLSDHQEQQQSPVRHSDHRPLEHQTNDLNGTAWLRNSISIWSDIRQDTDEMSPDHPMALPTMLVERLIQCFTTADERTVLDPMAGFGSTLVAAKRLGKVGIGMEASKEHVPMVWERLNPIDGPGQGIVFSGDPQRLLNFVDPESVDFGITSPLSREIPSWEFTDYDEFLDTLRQAYSLVYQVLKPGAYFCTAVMDMCVQGRFCPLHADLAYAMRGLGFIYEDLIIWDRRQDFDSPHDLEPPAVLRINRVHGYVLIFRKPEHNVPTTFWR